MPLTPREAVLAQVLADHRARGRAIVLSARFSRDGAEEDAARLAHAHTLGLPLIQPMATNTRDELAQALPQLFGHGTIVTSSYHQLRAFLTAVALLKQPWLVRIWNAPCVWRNDQLAGEVEKIAHYQARGDVATYEAGLAYLHWRDQHE